MLTEKECRAIVERVLKHSKADAVRVSLSQDETAHLRFARNTPSTSGVAHTRTLSVRSTFGTRSGSAQGNQLDPASIEAVVRRAEEVARRSPEDPEHVPELGPQEYVAVDAWSDETEEQRLERMAAGAGVCIDSARSAELIAAGFIQSNAGVRCLANDAGLFGYNRRQVAHFSETVRTPDGTGSGWASTAAGRVADLDFAGHSAVAVEKSRRSRAPRKLEPGDYPAILEPACVANLVRLLVSAMNARSADEGRSFFAAAGGGDKTGQRLFAPEVNLRSNPADPLAPVVPWSGDGMPHCATDWITGGVPQSLACSRFWAAESDRRPLPSAPNLLMEGRSGRTVEDLIAETERGVLVTNLWYIRGVDPQTLLYTGLTRDGVFWIEDGEIAYPVNNFRWNESPVRVLAGVEDLSEAVRVGGRGGRSQSAVVPALRVGAFGFSSISEAV